MLKWMQNLINSYFLSSNQSSSLKVFGWKQVAREKRKIAAKKKKMEEWKMLNPKWAPYGEEEDTRICTWSVSIGFWPSHHSYLLEWPLIVSNLVNHKLIFDGGTNGPMKESQRSWQVKMCYSWSTMVVTRWRIKWPHNSSRIWTEMAHFLLALSHILGVKPIQKKNEVPKPIPPRMGLMIVYSPLMHFMYALIMHGFVYAFHRINISSINSN